MKAFQISCPDDDYHGRCVVFADNRDKARPRDTRDCDCPFIEVRIVRAPSFDELSPGPVTTQQYLDRDWFFPCGNCDRHLYGDANPVIVKDYVFCNQGCVMALRESYSPEGAHESIVSLCEDLDEWLATTATPGGAT